MTPGPIIWITGVPAAGKSTLGAGIYDHLQAANVPTLWLDSDALREVMTPEPTYSDEERDIFYGTIAYLARRGAQGGVTVLVSATARRRGYRDSVRQQVERFTEVWLTCSPDALRRRDVKGLYARADKGQIRGLPGVDSHYEAPDGAEIVVDTTDAEPADTLGRVVEALRSRGVIA